MKWLVSAYMACFTLKDYKYGGKKTSKKSKCSVQVTWQPIFKDFFADCQCCMFPCILCIMSNLCHVYHSEILLQTCMSAHTRISGAPGVKFKMSIIIIKTEVSQKYKDYLLKVS